MVINKLKFKCSPILSSFSWISPSSSLCPFLWFAITLIFTWSIQICCLKWEPIALQTSWLWDQLTCRAVDLNTSWFGARIWVTLDNVWIGDKLTRVPRIGKSVGFKKRFWSKSDSQRWTEIVGSADLKRVDGDWKWYLNVNEYRIWRIIYRKLQNTTTRGHR